MFFKKLYNYTRNRYHDLKNDRLDKLYASNKNAKPRTLLILKIDAIGDYVLFRNFLKEVRESGKYREFRITLCGNEAWEDIATEYDSAYVDEFIWIKPAELYRSEYKRNLERRLYDCGFEECIYPAYSRTSFGDDLVKRSGAKQKITFYGDARNIEKKEKLKNDQLYDKLVEIKDKLAFEFYRYKEFFAQVLAGSITTHTSFFGVRNEIQKKVVICPGASAEWRRWSVDNFHGLVNWLNTEYKGELTFYICGSMGDKKQAELLKQQAGIEYTDLTGTQNLVELIEFMSNAFLVIANDSGPLHIAAACQVKVLGISNGNNYERFVPYPQAFNPYCVTVFPESLQHISRKEIEYLQHNDSKYPINQVSAQQAINELKKLLA